MNPYEPSKSALEKANLAACAKRALPFVMGALLGGTLQATAWGLGYRAADLQLVTREAVDAIYCTLVTAVIIAFLGFQLYLIKRNRERVRQEYTSEHKDGDASAPDA